MSLLPAGGDWDGVDAMVEGAVSDLFPELQQPDLGANVDAAGSDDGSDDGIELLTDGAGEEYDREGGVGMAEGEAVSKLDRAE